MISSNHSTNSNCAVELFKPLYFISDKGVLHLHEGVSQDMIYALEAYYGYEFDEIVIYADMDVCPVCGSKLNHNGRAKHKWNKNRPLLAQKYSCSKEGCNFFYETDIVFIEKYCCYDNRIRQRGIDLESIKHLSYQDKVDIVKTDCGADINRKTMYAIENKSTEEYLSQTEKELEELLKDIPESGIYHYDEEFCGNKLNKIVRLTILDDKTYKIINENIISQEIFDYYFVENFIRFSLKDINQSTFETPLYPRLIYSLPDLKKDTLITDGHKAYPSITIKVTIDHQKCVFHKIQRLTKDTFKTINRLESSNKKYKIDIKNYNQRIKRLEKKDKGKKGPIPSWDIERKKRKKQRDKLEAKKDKLKKEIKKNNKTIKQYTELNKRVSNIFKANSVEEAQRRFNILYNQIKFLPEPFAKFMKNLKKDFYSTIKHIINPEIPNTNNLLEGYYKITLPRHLKKIYRTEQGLKNRIRHSRIKWTRKMVLKMTN